MRISRTQMESLAASGGYVVSADGQKIGSIGRTAPARVVIPRQGPASHGRQQWVMKVAPGS
jgi:hypothetical protein